MYAPADTGCARPPVRLGVHRRTVVAALLSVVAGLTPAAMAAPPIAVAAACVDGWQPVGLPLSLSAMEPMAGATLAGRPAWIVGLTTARAEETRVPLIGTWTGSGWTKVTAPWSTYGVLNAVAATRSSNAWTVGAIGTYTRWPIAARWNGSQWNRVSVPRPAGQLAVFSDLALVDDVRFWAVGARLSSARLKPLAMFHRSDGWTTSSPAIPTDAEGGLTDVTLAPGGRVWAAGWRTNNEGQARPWLLQRTSSGWQTVALGAVAAGRASLTDVSFTSATTGHVVGFVDSPGGYRPILQRWNGSAWSSLAMPWADGRSVILNAVDADESGRLIVGGMEIGEFRRDVLAVLGPSGWTVTSLSPGTRERSAFVDTAPLTSGVMAFGFYDQQPITMLPCSSSAAAATSSSTRQHPSRHEDRHSADRIEPDEPEISQLASMDPGDTSSIASAAVAGTIARDMTAAAGLKISAPTWGGVVADFTGDGRPDVYINRHFQEVPLLMANSAAGVFSSVGSFAKRDRHNCAAADVDSSGSVDLFCTIGVNKGTSNTPHEFLLDVGNGGGDWEARRYGVMDGYGRGRETTFLNLDGDGHPDLYVVNEASRSDAMWSSNRLYRNDAGERFVSAAEWGVDRSLSGSCAIAGDLNRDGRDELLLCTGEASGGLSAGVRIFVNESGRLVDRTSALGITPAFERDLALADFNGDGRLDLAQVNGSRLRVSFGTSGAFQKAYELSVSAAAGMGVGDVNADGRPDIYLARRTSGNAGHLMLVNGGTGTSFTSMTIPQPGSGRAEDVLAIDYDGNGRTDFVTLNGWNVYGPVKLTAFYPN